MITLDLDRPLSDFWTVQFDTFWTVQFDNCWNVHSFHPGPPSLAQNRSLWLKRASTLAEDRLLLDAKSNFTGPSTLAHWDRPLWLIRTVYFGSDSVIPSRTQSYSVVLSHTTQYYQVDSHVLKLTSISK